MKTTGALQMFLLCCEPKLPTSPAHPVIVRRERPETTPGRLQQESDPSELACGWPNVARLRSRSVKENRSAAMRLA
ncbi:hypothetical protein BH23BAC4_BH23BAC4_12210 [soil metagenome]